MVAVTKSVFTQRYARFCELLVQARKGKGMTQTELGTALGEDQTFISKVESGVRRLDLVEFLAVADVLDIDVGEFVAELRKIRQE